MADRRGQARPGEARKPTGQHSVALCAVSSSTPTVQALRCSRFYLAWLQTHQQRKAAVKLQAFHRGNKARQEALWLVER